VLGRSAIQDMPNPVRDGRSLLGASTVYELNKSYPSKLMPQVPPAVDPPWDSLAGGATGGIQAARRYSQINIENMLPVIIVRLSPPLAAGKHNQSGLMNRLRSSYALLPLPGGSGQ
jgi:hypothetical protein